MHWWANFPQILARLMMKHGMAAETDQEPPAMGNLATSGICSLPFIHYQELVPTMITVSPHNINNCCFFSQNNNEILRPEQFWNKQELDKGKFLVWGSEWSDLSVTEWSGDCDASLIARNVPKFPFRQQTSYKARNAVKNIRQDNGICVVFIQSPSN